MRHTGLAITLAAVAAVAAAGPAHATTITLGSPLADPGTFDMSQHCEAEGCTVAQFSLPGATTEAPQAGTITHWRALAGGAMRLIVLHATGGGTYQEVGSSNPVTGDALAVHEYSSSVPIQAGDLIGLAFSAQSPAPNPGLRAASGAALGAWPKKPSLTTPAAPFNTAAYETPLQAELTVPDPSPPSPGTGETSSPGPTAESTPTSTSTATPSPLTTAPPPGPAAIAPQPPSIITLSLTDRRLRLGSRKGRATTTLRYQLSAPADLALDIQRSQCASRKKKGGKRCTKTFRTVATLRQKATTETGQLRLSTRVGRKALGAGRYQLSVTATNSAGRSEPRTVGFTLAR